MSERLQVLLLEDRLPDAELIVRELEKAGFKPDWQRVDTERDFALRLVPNLDLILSDFTLPGFTALRALDLLRESKLTIPFIIISGSIGDEQAVECLKKGAIDYLLKDRLARLGGAVRNAVDNRKDRQARVLAEAALKRSEEQMRGVLGTIEDVVFSLSLPDYRLNYMNPAGEKLFGRPLEEFFHDPQLWLQCVHPEDRGRMVEEQQKAIRWGTGESAFRIVRPDEGLRHVVSRVWTAFGPDGKPIRLEGIVTDTTEKRRAEEERIELELSRREGDRLRQLNEFKSQFLNMVAHDLNNIISPLVTGSHLLSGIRREGLTEAQGQAITFVANSVRRLTGFLADLLDAARLQSGKLAIAASSYDVSQQLQTIVESARPQALEKQVTLAMDVPPRVELFADSRRIEQVVTNLLGNAIKFTPPAGQVRLALQTDREGATITVTDSGIGIRPADMGKLFQPFSQIAVSQGKHTGTGLGLFISKGIVDGHGGHITASSPGEGKGATFAIHLPAREGKPGPESNQ